MLLAHENRIKAQQLAEWLKSVGYVFEYHDSFNSNVDFDKIGILAT